MTTTFLLPRLHSLPILIVSLLLVTLLSLSPFATSPAEADEPSPTLSARLTPLIEAHKGKVAVAVKDLKTGETFFYHADEPMPTASLIKFPVMIETYRQAAAKSVDLDTKVTLKKGDKVPGSGILTTHFSDGTSFPLVDAVHLMIVFSDNTATNLVLDAIGIGSTAATMESLGYPNTKIHSKVFRRDTSAFPERSKQFGLGSTTAAEMVRLFEALQRKELVSPEASEAMIKHLRPATTRTSSRGSFPRTRRSPSRPAALTRHVRSPAWSNARGDRSPSVC